MRSCVLACYKIPYQEWAYRVDRFRVVLALLHIFGRALFLRPLNRDRQVALLILFFNGGATLALVVELLRLILTAQVVGLVLMRVLDDLVEEALLAIELAVVLRPSHFGLVVLARRNHISKTVIVEVVDIRNLICNVFRLGLRNSVDFERILGTALVSYIRQEHLVVIGPVLVGLLQQKLRVDAGITTGVELPPSL